jgi:hypothetical protein
LVESCLYPCRAAGLEPVTVAFYRDVIATLSQARVPFLVCGSYALEAYTGNPRRTKDLDLFVRPTDCGRATDTLCSAGYRAEIVFPHWLAKVYSGEDFIDLIFSSGNGVCSVDDSWFAHAIDGEVLGLPVQLCPVEEIIWQKAFIMERERFDGADVAHLIRARRDCIDWARLLNRFQDHYRVLLAHLILYGFIYPHQSDIPAAMMGALVDRLNTEDRFIRSSRKVCQGPLLSRAQYLVDIEQRGYEDARLAPRGNMTPEEIERWTMPVREEFSAR